MEIKRSNGKYLAVKVHSSWTNFSFDPKNWFLWFSVDRSVIPQFISLRETGVTDESEILGLISEIIFNYFPEDLQNWIKEELIDLDWDQWLIIKTS